ncbi:hypothetical protein LTR95_000101 [Oleoguttula sp. CCFEE 5521]
MNSKSLRRLAADHAALHSQPLPPNYFFAPSADYSDDLTQLNVHLAGPQHTPFSAGVYKLHLTIPPTYPSQPPTAHFRTTIFHPNVDPQTGGVCVETLKRDWDVKLTLRDVLVTISCLLIQPNPDSALNAEAGALIQEGYEVFARRAKSMTGIHASIPRSLVNAVKEAQERGQERGAVGVSPATEETVEVLEDAASRPQAPVRRRRTLARVRAAAASRSSEGTPSGAHQRRRHAPGNRLFVAQESQDDVFNTRDNTASESDYAKPAEEDITTESDQENDEMRSPVPPPVQTPRAATPRRPRGEGVPLGELRIDDAIPVLASPVLSSSDEDDEMDTEYPPSPVKSPRQSPRKSPAKWRAPLFAPLPDSARLDQQRPESSRDAQERHRNITPQNIFSHPLAADSPYHDVDPATVSPRKQRGKGILDFQSPRKQLPKSRDLFGFATPGNVGGGVFKPRSPSSAEKRRHEQQRRDSLNAKLWEMCGQDIARWNRGDFGGGVFTMKGGRW